MRSGPSPREVGLAPLVQGWLPQSAGEWAAAVLSTGRSESATNTGETVTRGDDFVGVAPVRVDDDLVTVDELLAAVTPAEKRLVAH